MNTKIILGAVAAIAMLLPSSGALVAPKDFPLEDLLPEDFTCENGAHTTSFPDPLNPGLIVHVHIQCPGELMALDGHYGTDCPGDSWGHWIGPAKNAWLYTVDATNPYGFSQADVNAAFDAANKVWEAQVTANIYDGYVNGGTEANSGTFDQYILAEFRLLSGRLRDAVGVQWAWEGTGADAGKIIHTDAAYNTKYAFSLTGAANTYDLQSIAAHEMGHGYGLDHADTSTASKCLTLYPYATLGATHGRTLGDGDIHSIKLRGYGG